MSRNSSDTTHTVQYATPTMFYVRAVSLFVLAVVLLIGAAAMSSVALAIVAILPIVGTVVFALLGAYRDVIV